MILPRAHDVLFASYPGSGNTWLRRMLTHIIQSANTTAFGADGNSNGIYDAIPSLEKGFDSADAAIPDTRLVVKTHELASKYPNDVLYLLRRAEDSLVAYFHFRHARDKLNKFTGHTVDEFCLRLLPDWIAHVSDALALARAGDRRIMFVTYEDLQARPQKTLTHICRFLDVTATEESIQHAIQLQKIDRLKAQTPEDKWVKANLRRGRVGSARRELRPDTLAEIRRKADLLYFDAAARTPSSARLGIASIRAMTHRLWNKIPHARS